MKIALVIGNYDAFGGGAERWTDRHARMLLARGHDVHLVARHFRGVPDGATCHLIDAGKTTHQRRLRFARRVETLLPEISADVVHDMGDGWASDLLMPHHGTRRGTFSHNTRLRSPLMRRSRRFAYHWIPRYREFEAVERRQFDPPAHHLFLAVSKMISGHMQQYYRVPESRIRVVYNGVDTSLFRPAADSAERMSVRKTLGISDETYFLTVAHNFRLKGIDTLLRAMARLKRRGSRVKLVVVGDGPVLRYQGIARSTGCEDVVRFVGDQPDPLPYYQSADVFVLPTFYDPCSLVVMEAMAAGLPIITSRMNGVHELMQSGREGDVLWDPSDHEELADYMAHYLDPVNRQEAGAAARDLAIRHNSERMEDQFIAIYREIIDSRAAEALDHGAAQVGLA